MSKAKSTDLSPELMEQLRFLENMPEEAIDFSDIPECSDWSRAKRGMFYRPIKQQLTLRLDSDVVAWFKQQSQSDERGYQTLINSALRDFIDTKPKQKYRVRVGSKDKPAEPLFVKVVKEKVETKPVRMISGRNQLRAATNDDKVEIKPETLFKRAKKK